MKRGGSSNSKMSQRKSKSKSKSKGKDRKFDPLDYLNSLIDELHDHRTARKKSGPSVKR
jgi:hypothetical protein